MSNISSNKIKIFPQANRSSTYQTPPANLLTEDFIAGITRHAVDNASYVIDYDSNANKIKFVINGYYCEATIDDITPQTGKYLKATVKINTSDGSPHIDGSDDTSTSPITYAGIDFDYSGNVSDIVEYIGEGSYAHGYTSWIILLVNIAGVISVPDKSKVKINAINIDCGILP